MHEFYSIWEAGTLEKDPGFPNVPMLPTSSDHLNINSKPSLDNVIMLRQYPYLIKCAADRLSCTI